MTWEHRRWEDKSPSRFGIKEALYKPNEDLKLYLFLYTIGPRSNTQCAYIRYESRFLDAEAKELTECLKEIDSFEEAMDFTELFCAIKGWL